MVNYKGELLAIKGVGEKTVEDILTAFPDRKDLILAIMNKDDILFRDDVVEKLEAHFKGVIAKDEKRIVKGTVKINTKELGIRMRRAFNPRFNISVDGNPKLVKEDVAAYLLENYADRFSKVVK